MAFLARGDRLQAPRNAARWLWWCTCGHERHAKLRLSLDLDKPPTNPGKALATMLADTASFWARLGAGRVMEKCCGVRKSGKIVGEEAAGGGCKDTKWLQPRR